MPKEVAKKVEEVVAKKVEEVVTEVVTEVVATEEKAVAFIPNATSSCTIAGVQYIFVKGKEVKFPEYVVGILVKGNKGHKK